MNLKGGGVFIPLQACNRCPTGAMVGVFIPLPGWHLEPITQVGTWGKTVCISSIKHQTHATEVRQREVLQPSLSLGGHPEDPQAPCDGAHLRGEDTKAQLAVKTAQPVAWSRTRGREDVTSGQTELSQTLRVLASSGTSLQLTLRICKMFLAGSCEDQTRQRTQPGL